MNEIYSKINSLKSQNSVDFVFNKKYISNLTRKNLIKHWGKEYNFLRNKKYRKYYPNNDKFEINQFSSTAVVGNSGSLLGSEFGDQIDDHECIIRFNNAPIEGYEKDVGKKTTFRISIGTLNYRSGSEKLIKTYRRSLQPKMDFKRGSFKEDYHYIFTDDFISWIQELKSGEKKSRYVCSSGFIGVIFSFLVSEKISLYGFNLPLDNNHDYQYYSDVEYSEKAHNFELEHKIYNSFVEKDKDFKWIKN